MRQLFYVNGPASTVTIEIDPEFRYEFWRPSLLSARPKGLKKNSFLVWWMFHWLGVFYNDGYGVFTIDDGDQLGLGFLGYYDLDTSKNNS